jgi:hypothetical protein
MKKFFNKRVRGWFFTILVIILTFELSPYILSPLLLRHSFSRRDIKAELKNTASTEENNEKQESSNSNEYLGDHILHPYMGFVSIPHPNYNDFCFPGINPVTKKSKDKIHLVIMGGSVAKDIYNYTGERIIRKLKESPKFKGKEIDIVVFALGGFKQPQQLMALNYFMALGAEYDIIINIDGFNEIVLPYSDNLPNHVFPSYPRHWNIYSRKKLDSKVTLLMGKQAVIKNNINDGKHFMGGSIIKNCNFSLFIWKIIENKRNQDLASLESLLRNAVENSESDYQSTGIYTTVKDTLEFMKEQAKFWSTSSRQIAYLEKPAGFEYYHFLQPNQYAEGSKVMTREEMEIAFESNPFAYKDAVRIGYPLLKEEGNNLTAEGVNFTDLTSLFINEKRSVYNDKCCHFNRLGYDIIADKICETIISKTSDHSTGL